MHVLNVPWKLFVAIVPPTSLGGGFPCFWVAIIEIGILTGLIGDLANLLGCAIGLKNSVVAITLVALGTSLPDTFASRAAALGDPTADAAIGNVTGSNAVNVFLGLGLSWMAGAIYWVAKGADPAYIARAHAETSTADASKTIAEYYSLTLGTADGLIVPAGALGTSVVTFCTCGVLCILTLLARRVLLGGELGLSYRWPTFVFFVFLWLVYIVISALTAYEVM